VDERRRLVRSSGVRRAGLDEHGLDLAPRVLVADANGRVQYQAVVGGEGVLIA